MPSGAVASDPVVAETARALLVRGNAVDAVVAGVLAAAAESPSVFFGPFQALVGGGGSGLVAVDGRVRQPGLGAPRPRGVLDGEAVPEASRAGVPVLPAALATTLATLGASTLRRVASPALERARIVSPERAEVLDAFSRKGAPAIGEDRIAEELLAVAGRSARGLLTHDDLTSARPEVVRSNERMLARGGLLLAPWRRGAVAGAGADGVEGTAAEGSTEAEADAATTHVVAAVDVHGVVAIACYDAPREGVAVPALGLLLHRAAAPVFRGKTRVAPASPRPAASPIALRLRMGIVDLALGVALHSEADAWLTAALAALDRELTVTAAIAAAGGERIGRPVAIAQSRDAVRVLASA